MSRALKERDPSRYDGIENTAFNVSFFDFIKQRAAYCDVSQINCKTKQRILLDNKFKTKEEKLKCLYLLNHIDLFIYIDPSYNADTQSGIGLCCIFKPNLGFDNTKKQYIVTYMDHKFLSPSEIVNVSEIIISMIKNCIDTNTSLFAPSSILNFFIAIENNSSQAGAAQIHLRMSSLNASINDNSNVNIYLYLTKRLKNKKVQLGYNLGSEKRTIFSLGINMSNEKKFFFSSMIGTCRMDNSNVTIMNHFIYECTNLRFNSQKRSYSGKITRNTSDDLVTAYLCAIMLCKTYSDQTLDYKSQFIVYPWVKVTNKMLPSNLEDTDEDEDDDDDDDDQVDDD